MHFSASKSGRLARQEPVLLSSGVAPPGITPPWGSSRQLFSSSANVGPFHRGVAGPEGGHVLLHHLRGQTMAEVLA